MYCDVIFHTLQSNNKENTVTLIGHDMENFSQFSLPALQVSPLYQWILLSDTEAQRQPSWRFDTQRAAAICNAISNYNSIKSEKVPMGGR